MSYQKLPVTLNDDSPLYHQAFQNSIQSNIITTVCSGKMVLVNEAACKLLGYTKKELLRENRSTIFDIKERTFKKMLKQRIVEGHSVALVTAIKKNGKTFPCEITSAIFTDEDGVEQAITTIADITRHIARQKIIDTKKEKIVADNIHIAKSIQKKIDAKKDKIVSDNISIAKSKQITIDTKKDKIVANNISIAKSKQITIDTKNNKIVADNIVRAKSKQKAIDTKKEKIVADNIILAQTKSNEESLAHDIATTGKLQEEYRKRFDLIFNSSSDILYDIDLMTNEIILSDAYEKDFGYKIKDNMTAVEDWSNHIHPDDKQKVIDDYLARIVTDDTEWKYTYRFLRADNSVANILSSGIILRKPDGKAYRMIGSMHDISKQKVLEERLEQEINLKEKQIADAMDQAKETERSDIGRELHDNVNQLLSASRLYLEMARKGGEHSEMYLNRSSQYTHSAIEDIRKISKGLTTDSVKVLGLCDAIVSLSQDIMEVRPVKIICSLNNFKEKTVLDKFKVNLYRIVQEQLNNILKHARATSIIITLLQNKKSILLTVADDGVGFDTDKTHKGIGISNIQNRVTSYHGDLDLISQPGKGCILKVCFPVMNALQTVKN